jgi:S-methylmethionine-dependent homocysteine/selenocysteine methylase
MPLPLSTLLSPSTTSTPLILDGALATYLETLGASISTSLWSASLLSTSKGTSLIQRAHLDYFRAGANIAITASYQASIPGLCEGLGIGEEEARALVRRSVELARRAREEYIEELRVGLEGEGEGERKGKEGEGPAEGETEARAKAERIQRARDKLLIAGSIGPYGAYLANGSEYTGFYTPLPSPSTFASFHRGRIQALVSPSPSSSHGIDILACETLPSYPETLALITLLTTEFPTLKSWFSFTLLDSSHISDGTPLSSIVSLLDPHPNIVAIGINCIAADSALSALQTLQSLTSKPLIVYANSGEVWDAAGREWRGERTQGALLADRARAWWEAGARIIGGCCRTTPEDIRVIAKTFRDVDVEVK